MKPCEDRSEDGMCLIDNQTPIHLHSEQASAFRQWFSDLEQTLQAITQQTQQERHLNKTSTTQTKETLPLPTCTNRGPWSVAWTSEGRA